MSARRDWHSLHELDRAAGRAKGASFRAFKRLRPAYREGEDFVVLDHRQDAAAIAVLRDAGRLYASSVNVVLVGAGLAAAIHADLQSGSAP